MTRTVAEVLREARAELAAARIDNAARDARALVAFATNRRADRLSLEGGEAVSPEADAAVADLVAQRSARKPVSHLIGRRAFWTHAFLVTPDVLDPRPETEVLVQAALSGPVKRVLDLGTGSGAILLSILADRPSAEGVGTDLSAPALAIAGQNAQGLGVEARVRFVVSDWFAEVSGSFDLIVSNPPYIAQDEMGALAPELAFEPRMALTDEADGLTAYRAIAAGAGAHLTPGGRLMVEIGPTQAEAVSALFAQAGLTDVQVLPDLDGRDRVVSARAP